MKKDLYIITGCDSGIGKACAELLMSEGRSVAVSYLDKDPFSGEPLCRSFRADMTGEGDVGKFAKNIHKLCYTEYSLRCLFLNAGIALGGPVENLALTVFRRVMEVNFFSYVSLIQKLIPLLRESRGMIMIHGSLAGRIAMPFLSPYSSSKFALEGFTDSLRRELNPFGIKTVLIEPAAVATPIWTKALEADRSFVSDVYMDSVSAFMENFVAGGARGMPVEKAAADIVRIMNLRNPSSRYVITGTPFNSFLQKILPDRVIDRLVRKFFRMNYG